MFNDQSDQDHDGGSVNSIYPWESIFKLLSNINKTELSQEESNDKLAQLTEAENQLEEQSKIIEEEIETRNYLEQLMSNFILAQRKLVSKKKERLKNCKNKLQSIEDVKCSLESQLLDAALVDDELESIPMPDS